MIDPDDIELNQWEFQLVMGKAWEDRDIFIESIACDCKAQNKKLIDFKVYLTNLNDLVLKGKCSGCGTIAARYIETGEDRESFEAALRIRKMKQERN